MDFDGALELERAWREGLTPDPLLSVSQWSDRHRILSSKASAKPGRWRTRRTPCLKEIMNCLSPTSPVERVVFMKGAQCGATEAGSNWIGYAIYHAAGPMMAVRPTVDMATVDYQRLIDRFDHQTGAPAVTDIPNRPFLVRTYELLLTDRADITAMRGWLAGPAGRQAPFWVPTWERGWRWMR
jgi:hypothetical protein